MIDRKIERPDDPKELRGYEQAMRDRCELEGHKWQNGIRADFGIFSGRAVFRFCEWCGAER